MEKETWDSLLSFLLAINDALLAPPAVKEDVGDQLCERVLGVLYEIWLIACVKSFPGPTLWKTFQEMCMNWRHRTGLIVQWNRVNVALLARQLQFMYGGKIPQLIIPKEDAELVPEQMTRECIAQAAYDRPTPPTLAVECRQAPMEQTALNQAFEQYGPLASATLQQSAPAGTAPRQMPQGVAGPWFATVVYRNSADAAKALGQRYLYVGGKRVYVEVV